MSLEEEHQAMHRRGEMIKFLLLLLALVGTVLVLALLRPLIFERIVPAVLGLDREPVAIPALETATPSAPQATPETEIEGEMPRIMTATPPAVDVQGDDAATDGAGSVGGSPQPTTQMYEIQQGDTLVEIAERFGVTVSALVQANGIANPNRIQPGEMLVIPSP